MKTRKIPGTDMNVSEICFGTMNFGTPVGEDEAVRLMHYGLDRGINFIDTANMYEGYTRKLGSPGGISEEYVGKGMKGNRSRYIVATKVGSKVGEGPEDEFCSPAAVKKYLERSLRLMQTDYIDIFYAHRFDPHTPPEELAGAMAQAMREGKIRQYAVSNYSGAQLTDLLEAADRSRLPRPVLCQPPLSLLKQEALDDVIRVCAEQKIGVVPYQVLQGGLLTGKYKRGSDAPADSRKAESSGWVWDLTDAVFEKLDVFETSAKARHLTMTAYAVQWALAQPAVVSALIGFKRIEQIDDAVQAATTD
jgi:L-glyceraldehyde 3-phosphate reductase